MTKKRFLWLFTLPLLPLIIFGGVRGWQAGRVVPLEAGSFKSDEAGEKRSLAMLSIGLEDYPHCGEITVRYFVHPKPKPTWIVVLYYRRNSEILQKQTIKPPSTQGPNPVSMQKWASVSEDAIHRITAVTRTNQTTEQDVRYEGGRIADLSRFGATQVAVHASPGQ